MPSEFTAMRQAVSERARRSRRQAEMIYAGAPIVPTDEGAPHWRQEARFMDQTYSPPLYFAELDTMLTGDEI